MEPEEPKEGEKAAEKEEEEEDEDEGEEEERTSLSSTYPSASAIRGGRWEDSETLERGRETPRDLENW